MLAAWREPWWKAVLVGLALTLIVIALGVWQLTVVTAAVAGFLSGRGRSGAVRGIQAAGPAWILALIAVAIIGPVDRLATLLGDILGAGWGLVLILYALIPILLGGFGGLAGGYLAELLERESPAPPSDSEPVAR